MNEKKCTSSRNSYSRKRVREIISTSIGSLSKLTVIIQNTVHLAGAVQIDKEINELYMVT